MGKLDVGVGDEFPVDEPPEKPEAGSPQDDCRQHYESWQRHRDEWGARKNAWKADLHAWRDGFRAEMRDPETRQRFRENFERRFGARTIVWPPSFLMRVAIAIGLLVLAIAALPLMFLFGLVALCVFMFAAGRRHRDYSTPQQ